MIKRIDRTGKKNRHARRASSLHGTHRHKLFTRWGCKPKYKSRRTPPSEETEAVTTARPKSVSPTARPMSLSPTARPMSVSPTSVESSLRISSQRRHVVSASTAESAAEAQPGSLVYDLKHMKSTRVAPVQERHRRLFKISALLQDRFKSLMRNLTTVRPTQLTKRGPKATPKCNCTCREPETTTVLREDMKDEGFKISCNRDNELNDEHETTTTPTTMTTTAEHTTTTHTTEKCYKTPVLVEERRKGFKYKGHVMQDLPNDTLYMEPDAYNDQAYYESGPLHLPPPTQFIEEPDYPEKHYDIKRDVKTEQQNIFTAKDVAALEVIVDLMKNTLSYEEKDIASVFNNNFMLANSTKCAAHNENTNSIQVHIAIPFDFQGGKKRSPLDPVRVRKIFSAKMSTPVDMEYQVHSFEGTIAPTTSNSAPPNSSNPSNTVTTIQDNGLSPGMYLLVDKPKSGYALKPVKGKINMSDLRTRQAGTTAIMTAASLISESISEASVNAPNMTAPSMIAPSMTAPSMTAPSINAPIIPASIITAPIITAPIMSAPIIPEPSMPAAIMTEDKPTASTEMETTSLKSLAKVTLSKDFISAVNRHLIELYENMTNINKNDKRKIRSVWKTHKLKKEHEVETIKSADKYICKRRIDWEAVKKYFGHDRVCNCKCQANKAMCRACAASDAVVDELIFEFDNLGRYMNDHCTEIQTYFWMNPTGGARLRDSVTRIDKSLSDYYKRVKGKCQGRTCKTFTTYIDKREIVKTSKEPKQDVFNHLINDLSALAEDINKTVALKTCFNNKLKEEGEKFLHAIHTCIKKMTIDKRSLPMTTKKKLIKNVYSLDNINVNIICNPEVTTTTIQTDPYDLTTVTHLENTARVQDVHLFDYGNTLPDNKPKKRKGFKKLFPRKNKKDKLFTYYISPYTTKRTKLHFKRDIDSRMATPLISDGGGAFWYDYIKGSTNEPRIVRESGGDDPKLEIALIQTGENGKPKIQTMSKKKNSTFNTIYMTVKTSTKKVIQRDTETTMDYLTHNINQLLQLFGSLQDIEAMNMHSNRSTMFLSHSTTNETNDKTSNTIKSTKYEKNLKSKTQNKGNEKSNATQYSNMTVSRSDSKLLSTGNPPDAIETKVTSTTTANSVQSTNAFIPGLTTTTIVPKDVAINSTKETAFIATNLEKTGSVTKVDTKTQLLTTEVKKNTNLIQKTSKKLEKFDKVEDIADSKEIFDVQEPQSFRHTTASTTSFLAKLKTATLRFFDNMGKTYPYYDSETTMFNLTDSSNNLTQKLRNTERNWIGVGLEDSSQRTTHMSPTIVIINEYDNQINSELLKDSHMNSEGYKNLLLSIIQYETNRLNDEWHRIAYSREREEGDIKRSVVEFIKRESTTTTKPETTPTKAKPPADYDMFKGLKKISLHPELQLPEPDDLPSSKQSFFNKIVNKIGMKVVPVSKMKAVKRPDPWEVTKRKRKRKGKNCIPASPFSEEACDARRTPKSSQICDIRATYEHILELQKTLPSNKFEELVKNISCFKYKSRADSFYIPYEQRGKRWDWIRKKRALRIHFTRVKDETEYDDEIDVVDFDNDDDEFERFVKGDDGIYKTMKRRKRTASLTALERGLRNIPPLMPGENELYVMDGDSITLDCIPNSLGTNSLEDHFHWRTDRSNMLKQDNVQVRGVKVTIKNVEPRNIGSYTCSQDATVKRNVRLTVMTLPAFDVVFLPVYETEESCTYDDLKAIQHLGASMAGENGCGNVCSVRIDEPVCQKDRSTNSSLVRSTAVISMSPRRVNCSVQCRRDIISSLAMLCATNTPALTSVGVVVSKDGVNGTMTPCRDFGRPVVTHRLRKKDSNGHREYHRLISTLAPGKVDVVLICPAGYYLIPDQKICASCPPNTRSQAGDNTCTTCPRGTRSGPGALSCEPPKPPPPPKPPCRAGTVPRAATWWPYAGWWCSVACARASPCWWRYCRAISRLRTSTMDGAPIKIKEFTMIAPQTRPGSRVTATAIEIGTDVPGVTIKITTTDDVAAAATTGHPRPLSPSRVILARFFKPSLTSSRATDSQETKFELWKERNRPPPLPPIDFDI